MLVRLCAIINWKNIFERLGLMSFFNYSLSYKFIVIIQIYVCSSTFMLFDMNMLATLLHRKFFCLNPIINSVNTVGDNVFF